MQRCKVGYLKDMFKIQSMYFRLYTVSQKTAPFLFWQ